MRLKVALISIFMILAVVLLSGCFGSKAGIDQSPSDGQGAGQMRAMKKINSGLLIGLAKTTDQKNNLYGTQPVEYRTLWISQKETGPNSGLNYLEGPGFILTPYGSDFWKIENSEYHFGAIGENEKKYYNDKIDYNHNLVLFSSHNAGEKAKTLYTRDTFKRPASEKDGYTEWDIKHQRVYEELLYAGNNYACIKSSYFYDTGGSMRFNGYSIDTYEIGNLQTAEGRGLNNKQLMGLLPAGAPEMLNSLAQKYDKTVQGEAGFIQEKEFIDKDNPYLRRIGGRWEAVAPLAVNRRHPGNGSSGTAVKESIKLSLLLPETITSHDALCKGWEEIIQKYPDAKDALSSPEKDMLLILTQGQLLVFIDLESGIDTPALAIDVEQSEGIILNQWAIGENVRKWDAALKKYLMTAQESKDYTTIKDREKRSPYAGLVGDDYMRVVPLDELAARTAAACKFIADYPSSPCREEMTVWKDEYLHDYLSGNFKYSSSFDWMSGSNAFMQDHLKSYEDSKEKYKGTAFASLLNEYTKLIKQEGNRMTDKVRDFVAKYSKDEQVIFKLPG